MDDPGTPKVFFPEEAGEQFTILKRTFLFLLVFPLPRDCSHLQHAVGNGGGFQCEAGGGGFRLVSFEGGLWPLVPIVIAWGTWDDFQEQAA